LSSSRVQCKSLIEYVDMAKFVWIFGPTSAGKDTLIQKILAGKAAGIIEVLDLQQPIIASEASLTYRQQARNDLVFEIGKIRPNGETVLIKGQGFDITEGNNIPERLEGAYPDDEHLYVYLDANPSTLKSRREQRGEPNSTDDEGARRDMLRIASEFERNGFKVKWFTNDDDAMPVEIPKPIL
jgi:hypothetical protein